MNGTAGLERRYQVLRPLIIPSGYARRGICRSTRRERDDGTPPCCPRADHRLGAIMAARRTWSPGSRATRPAAARADGHDASEIAAGDLTKRVEDADERTEVGQLGAALNVMLTQIERAFREREASEDRLRRFVGDASHELRTPLTSIRGYAELLQGRPGRRPEDLATALRPYRERVDADGRPRRRPAVARPARPGAPARARPCGFLAQLAADAVQDASVVDGIPCDHARLDGALHRDRRRPAPPAGARESHHQRHGVCAARLAHRGGGPSGVVAGGRLRAARRARLSGGQQVRAPGVLAGPLDRPIPPTYRCGPWADSTSARRRGRPSHAGCRQRRPRRNRWRPGRPGRARHRCAACAGFGAGVRLRAIGSGR